MINTKQRFIFIALAIALVLLVLMMQFAFMFKNTNAYADSSIEPYVDNTSNLTKYVPSSDYNLVHINRIGGMLQKIDGVIRDSSNSGIINLRYDNSSSSQLAQIQFNIGLFGNLPKGWGLNDQVYNYIDFDNKQFVQNVARVNLGSLDWTYDSSTPRFVASLSDCMPDTRNLLSSIYVYGSVYNPSNDMVMYVSSASNLSIKNTSYTSAVDFKTAMSGVYLYYQLATPVVTDLSNNSNFANYNWDLNFSVTENSSLTLVSQYVSEIPTIYTFYNSNSGYIPDYADVYQTGYDDGYDLGEVEGSQASTNDAYQNGYSNGYTDGYEDVLGNLDSIYDGRLFATSLFGVNSQVSYASSLQLDVLVTNNDAENAVFGFNFPSTLVSGDVVNLHFDLLGVIKNSTYKHFEIGNYENGVFTAYVDLDLDTFRHEDVLLNTQTWYYDIDTSFSLTQNMNAIYFKFYGYDGSTMGILDGVSMKIHSLNLSFAITTAERRGYSKAEEYYSEYYSQGGAGYKSIYNKGYYDYPNDDHYTFRDLIVATIDTPIKAFTTLFDYDILGVNMKTFYLSLFTLAVIITIIRLVL